jgi:hypothetical protein
MKKITDRKLLIGYRFKGNVGSSRQGRAHFKGPASLVSRNGRKRS